MCGVSALCDVSTSSVADLPLLLLALLQVGLEAALALLLLRLATRRLLGRLRSRLALALLLPALP